MTINKQYAPFYKGWQGKVLGDKPSDDLLATAHNFGRAGKQSLALAMAMRPEGVSGAQIVMACGAPQNNHRRGLLASGYFKRDAVPANAQGHTVYKITLTPRGEAAIKRRAEAAAKATLATTDKPKRKATSKRKGKAKPVTAPEAPATAENAPAATPEAPQGNQPTA